MVNTETAKKTLTKEESNASMRPTDEKYAKTWANRAKIASFKLGNHARAFISSNLNEFLSKLQK